MKKSPSKQVSLKLPWAEISCWQEFWAGLRWIIEALTRGDLDGIRADWLCRYSDFKADREATEATLTKLKIRLRDKQHVLVGHNLFTDLGFLFATFFGPLPDKVVEFQNVINVLFPNVIDTKFLHTEGNITDGAGRETLKEILAPFRKIHRPMILLHENHSSYGSTGANKDHEAGYDSMYSLYTHQLESC